MSYDPRQAARAYGEPYAVGDQDGRKGSVRAARERMQADQMRTQLPDTSKIIGLPQRPNQLVSQYSNQNAYEQPRLAPTTDYRGAGNTVSPTPQWPLANYGGEDDNTSPILPPRSPKRLQRPQQDIRPISDEFPIQQQSPGYSPQGYSQNSSLHPDEYGGSYPNDEMFSPNSYRSSRPLTTSSAASESSSLGSIPDFPVPQPPVFVQQSRRQPSLGPPPSSRRGPSSYYTQMSYVSPIAEESETRSDRSKSRHGSYASSNVFPSNPGDMYRDDYIFSDDEETITSDRGTLSPTDTDDKSGLVTPQSALLRQASLGRRTKPSLMTIRSVDSVGDKKNGTTKRKPVGVGLAAGAMAAGGAQPTSSLSKGTGYYDASSSSESVDTIKNLKSQIDGYSGYGSPPLSMPQDVRPKTLAERVGERRPPRLDVDAVRDAEARGSLTSLPDLIRRATRLAANLDRGKTASRLGLDFWEAGAPEKKDTRQSGLSDMLAAFPPPGQDTPNRTGTPNNRMSKWPSAGIGSRAGMTDSALSNEKSGKRRKCCGMPMWTFITLLIVLLFIIAAAVVIPVVLIVIPNQNSSNAGAQQENQGQNSNGNNNPATTTDNPSLPAPTVAPGTNQCDGVITCQNGGVAVLNSDRTCNCICINGFTGRACTNNDATGCTTTSIDTVNNATMGSGIPRLIETATTDFKVPLNGTRILSLFSTLSLSCAAENALITFNGLASRSVTHSVQSVHLEHIAGAMRSLSTLHHPHQLRTIHRLEDRQAIGEVQSTNTNQNQDQNQNQNQRVTNQPTTTQVQPISSNVTALDFARVGVLLALQETGELDTAANAQEAIQTFLSNNQNGNTGNTINLNVFQLDLVNLSIRFQNGTTIGPRK